jgi:hypothetical protein
MKKLTLALSAIVAAFSATAQADVSVSGTTGAAYVSNAAASDNTDLIVGSSVAFALSTTTASGLGISAGMGISLDPDSNAGHTANATSINPAVTGGNAVTFTTGGATIVVGDVEAADTPGSVGGAVGGIVDDNNGTDTNVGSGFADDDGLGFSLSTGVGAATLSLVYVNNDDTDNHGVLNHSTAQSATSASVSLPMGDYTVSVGVADHDNGQSAAGASISAALGGGTLVVGYSNQTMIAANTDITTAGDTQIVGATYAMSLDADTTVKLGYQTAKDADSDSTSRMDVSISRSLGGGASVYLDMRNLSGDAATDGTAIGFGTSVSF